MNAAVATQVNRQASFHCPLPFDELMLNEMVALEKVSGLFEYKLVLSSEDENIDLNDLVGQPARVELQLRDGSVRDFSGIITEFTFASYRDNFAEYRAILKPWLWLLTRASNNRIFQNTNVPAIIKSVCAEHGFTDIDDRLTSDYENRVFCVQYRETDFDFLSRLMEEEGIYYYFEHSGNQHILKLVDDVNAHEPFPDYDIVPYYPPDADQEREDEHLDDWILSRAVRSGNYCLTDFDFKNPRADLEVRSSMEKLHANAGFERYEYPGRYDTAEPRGNTLVRSRLEEAQTDHEVLCSRGNVRGMAPGHVFDLELFPRVDQNRRYLILEVKHRLRLGGFDSGGVGAGDRFEYDCGLTVMPACEPYRPPRNTVKPVVYGPQTAIVVGQVGDEITTDRYGQIKVKFHWDRDPARNQNSSCWVRVSQAWAGSGWGAQFIPRIGQEVVVEFLEGDPDRPLVTGSVYNASNMPPYDPANKPTQSGIKTHSTPGGTSDNFNEIRFDDKKGAEELYIHAEKDMKIEVENDRTKNVAKNETVTIGENRSHTVDGTDTQRVKKTQNITIDEKRTLHCKSDELRDIDAASTQEIGGKWTTTAQLGVDIISPLEIKLDSKATITLDAPSIVRTDENWISKSSHSLAFNGLAIAFSGVTIDLKGNATGIFATNIALNGLNVGVNVMNIGYNAIDASKNGVELKASDLSLKKYQLKMQKKALDLVMKQLSLQKGGLDLKKYGLSMKA